METPRIKSDFDPSVPSHTSPSKKNQRKKSLSEDRTSELTKKIPEGTSSATGTKKALNKPTLFVDTDEAHEGRKSSSSPSSSRRRSLSSAPLTPHSPRTPNSPEPLTPKFPGADYSQGDLGCGY